MTIETDATPNTFRWKCLYGMWNPFSFPFPVQVLESLNLHEMLSTEMQINSRL